MVVSANSARPAPLPVVTVALRFWQASVAAAPARKMRRDGLIASHHVEAEHHPHVFVLDVVAVADEAGAEVAELHEHLRLVAWTEQGGVVLEGVLRRRGAAVEPLYLMRLEVEVDGVPPAAAAVLQDPAFGGASADGRIDAVLVVEAPVHLPGAFTADELE